MAAPSLKPLATMWSCAFPVLAIFDIQLYWCQSMLGASVKKFVYFDQTTTAGPHNTHLHMIISSSLTLLQPSNHRLVCLWHLVQSAWPMLATSGVQKGR